jgi:propionyl-CoA carboxylase alpha chain
MFEKILVANRGEIAVRIVRTCRRMGIGTVAVYSDPDFRSLHVRHADEAVALGGDRPADSYLHREKLISIAKKTGCRAVHPGYGFLSENAAFAREAARAGLVFVGPPPEVIASLGDKIAAKKLACSVDLPTVPGHLEPVSGVARAAVVAGRAGYPVLLKPAGGGGGKGMRIVDGPGQLASALAHCQQEARKAFGDDSVFVERYIRSPRHIEFQILADGHGRVVHLGERECSIQRRYQKIIEESPSTALDEDTRRRMGALACDLARAAGYVSAGTVEFILDRDGSFYFLEMNTRLQVEHPVTEMTTGLDLVELQLRIAAGEPLPFSQEEVTPRGWAIETRICAEDPERGFAPSVGLITRYAAPRGDHVRVDSGVDAGSSVDVFYDPMLAKVITWGRDREEARCRMVQALNGCHVEGVSTNVDFANRVLTHPSFVAGALSTDFIERHLTDESRRLPPPEEDLRRMAVATTLIHHLRENLVQDSLRPLKPLVGGGSAPKRRHRYVAKAEADIFEILLEQASSERHWRAEVNGAEHAVVTPPMEYYRRRLRLGIDDQDHTFRFRYRGNFIEAAYCGITRTFEIYNPREWALARHMPPPAPKKTGNALECPMPGLVVEIRAAPGDRVFRGQELLVIESMKMESAVLSPRDGEVERIHVSPGDAVDTGVVLMTFRKP